MSEKKVGKRLLTWVLVLVMTLSTLPLNVLAAETASSDVKIGHYNENGNWTEGAPIQNPPMGVDSVNKTAEPTDNPNEYTVKLEVVLKETTTNVPSQAATVLVIDTSGSMACEKKEHTHSDKCYAGEWEDCTRENHPDHWDKVPDIVGVKHWKHTDEDVGCEDNGIFFSQWQYYVKAEPEELRCNKEEHTHSSACDCRINAAKAAARNFLDSYRLNATAGRYVALVDFNTTAKVAAEWQDVSTSDGYTAILNAINNLSANGGTNLEQGLVNAQTLLSDPTVSSIAAKHVIALTDGEPTLYGKDGKDGGRNYCDVDTFDATNTAATNLKAVARLHTISFGTSTEKMLKKPASFVWESNEYWEYTVSEYLAACVASPESAYSADNADQLNSVFAAISTDITSGLSSGTVHDSLPDGVTCISGDFEGNWNLTGATGEPGEGGVTTYTYTKTYTVKIDPTAVNAEQYGGYYPLNGPTTLTVGDDVVIDFPIPAGKVTLQKYTVKWVDDNGTTLLGTATLPYGTSANDVAAKAPENPTKEADAQYTYTFTGWTPAYEEVKGDKTYTATYKATTKEYTVKWVDEDGTTVLGTETLPYGTSANDVKAKAPADPTKPADAQFTYTFKGWTPDVVRVTDDATYTATYKATTNEYSYTVQYYYNGETKPFDSVEIPNVTYNTSVTSVDDSSKLADGYVRDHTTGLPATITDNSIVIAVYYKLRSDLKYTVNYLWNNSAIQSPTTGEANYGDIITLINTDISGYTIKPNQEIKYSITTDERVINLYYRKNVELTANSGTVTYDGTKHTVTGYTGAPDGANFDNVSASGSGTAVGDYAVKFNESPIGKFATVGAKEYIITKATDGKLTIKGVPYYPPYYPPVPPTVEIEDDDALGLNTTDHFAYIVGYGNGEVRPQNNITRAEVATIFFRLLTDDVRDENLTKTNRYSDVAATSWYNTAVSTLSSMGIITGYPDGTFRPNAAITRAEFAAIAARFDNDGDKTAAKFSDIATHWAKDEISIAYNNGWITGYPNGTFGPQRDITRAETMTLVNRVLNRQPETEDDLLPNMTVWTDNANPKAWYYLAVQEATNSHYYEFKTNSQYEKWTELRETRDWTQLEK